MKIKSITMKSFRCFGPEGVTVSLDDTTALIGANGSGKTAVLLALLKIFGGNRGHAQLEKSDFHISPGSQEVESRTLELETRIEFPGLESADFDEPDPSIPAFINQILIDNENDVPHCILKLNATWTRDDSAVGDIETELNWMLSPNGIPEDEERKTPAVKGLKPRVSVIYVPAVRDPYQHVRQTAGSVLYRLFRCIRWSSSFPEKLNEVAEEISASFSGEKSITKIKSIINESWKLLHGDRLYGEIDFQPLNPEVAEFLRGVSTVFFPNEEDESADIGFLSDGLRSLFYLTLILSMSEIDSKALEERKTSWMNEGNSDEENDRNNEETSEENDEEREPALRQFLDLEKLKSPLLTILAIEEPENHLSPHYLGKIMDGLNKLANKSSAQVVLTSHSPSILSRIEPENVRHLSHDIPLHSSKVVEIPIPPKDDDNSEKFVREAVQAYPELYFARCVILGEGASEEIVLRKILRAYGIASDRQLISIVPLGGRHINHFWKLLSTLEIPFYTLIDLDLGREFGGVDRLKEVAKELGKIGNPLTRKINRDGEIITEEVQVPNLLEGRDEFGEWIEKFYSKNVFFSAPLDLDFSLLNAYKDAYDSIQDRGPNIPGEQDSDYGERLSKVVDSVLGNNGNQSFYQNGELRLFWNYRYHFLNKSKPSSHLRALNTLSNQELQRNCPDNLKRLVKAVASELDIEVIEENE